MKEQSGLKFPSELRFGIMNTTKDSYLLNSKVAFLKRGNNAAGIWFGHPDFLRYCKVLRYLAGSLSHPKNHNLEIFSQ